MTWLLIALPAFLAGYLWGKGERAVLHYVFDREESPVRAIRRILGHRTDVSTWTVVVSLLISIVVGGYVVAQKREDASRTDCSIEFNRLSATARDDRLAAQNAALQAQVDSVRQDIDYQRRLRGSLTADHPTLGHLLGVLDRKVTADQKLLSTLLKQQRVAATHTYPPPDFCEPR